MVEQKFLLYTFIWIKWLAMVWMMTTCVHTTQRQLIPVTGGAGLPFFFLLFSLSLILHSMYVKREAFSSNTGSFNGWCVFFYIVVTLWMDCISVSYSSITGDGPDSGTCVCVCVMCICKSVDGRRAFCVIEKDSRMRYTFGMRARSPYCSLPIHSTLSDRCRPTQCTKQMISCACSGHMSACLHTVV